MYLLSAHLFRGSLLNNLCVKEIPEVRGETLVGEVGILC